jgi:hypothetical protein
MLKRNSRTRIEAGKAAYASAVIHLGRRAGL